MPFWHIATHGHALQLAVGETIKAINIIRGTLDAANTLFEGKELLIGWEKTLHQETLMTEHCAQIVGLSEGYFGKPF